MQYEDATDNVQSIREKLELERAAKCAWLREAAASCAQSSAAANGSAHGNGHAGMADDSGSIALSLAYTQRAQRDLRVSKQQVGQPGLFQCLSQDGRPLCACCACKLAYISSAFANV